MDRIPKFAIHPGPVLIGDKKVKITAIQIAFDYKVPFNDWFTWSPEVASKHRWDEFRHLFPRPDGTYGLGDEHEKFRAAQHDQASERSSSRVRGPNEGNRRRVYRPWVYEKKDVPRG